MEATANRHLCRLPSRVGLVPAVKMKLPPATLKLESLPSQNINSHAMEKSEKHPIYSMGLMGRAQTIKKARH